jgi:peptide/nickel transport system ATP-binding protein
MGWYENSTPWDLSPGAAAAYHGRPMATLLEVRHLTTRFLLDEGEVRAVEDVSFALDAGESLGLVGESGCGKSVTALSLLRLVDPPGRIVGGEVLLEGRDLLALEEREMRRYRGAGLAMVFQEPATALNPVMSIGSQVAEAVRAHHPVSRAEAQDRALQALEQASVPDAARRARDYPHQLSGGLRQRAMIAMALAAGPKVLVADEPTTALDVTIQAQILDLLAGLRRRLGLGLLLITHDLGVVARSCDRVAVMYAGRIVETGRTRALLAGPLHPYTRGLLDALPGDPAAEASEIPPGIPGTVPDLANLPPGCAFAPRCPEREARCEQGPPPLVDQDAGRAVACVLHGPPATGDAP